MNNEIMNIHGIDCYEKDGVAYLKLEAVARGLGFTKTDVKFSETGFRKEYVRIDWPRVEKYLDDLGVHTCAHDDFIPENIFYRLAMKAKNAVAEAFQAKVADEIIPAIRKTGSYNPQETDFTSLSPQLQCLINLERKQQEHDKAIAAVNKQLEDIRDVVTLNPNSWREDTRHLISKIATAQGGFDRIRDVNAEIYNLVDARGKVSLATRLTNKRRRMADEGVCKSKRDKLTKVDVIADDPKLIEIYSAVVKDMTVKNGVGLN